MKPRATSLVAIVAVAIASASAGPGAQAAAATVAASLAAQAATATTSPTPPTAVYTDLTPSHDFPASEPQLESSRARGDLPAQRAHLWQILTALSRPAGNTDTPVFLTWYGAGEVFAREARPALQSASSPGLRSGAPRDLQHAFSVPINAANTSSAPPRITRGHYNFPAYHHIRDYGLFSRKILTQQVDTIQAFPRSAVVLKSVWWPVPAVGVVALPVWDAVSNPCNAAGNDYPTWPRVVGISSQSLTQSTTGLEFMGKHFKRARLVSLSAFFHVEVDQTLATAMMSDPEARKLTVIALGRPLEAGDSLALVALHVATRELVDWVWGTFWWHDAPDDGPYATLRPDNLTRPWRNYLMNVAFDRDLPRGPDGTPHVAYNPWLEARFADSGQGSGVVSNCMSCHERASTAVDQPFAVTRGDAPLRPNTVPIPPSAVISAPSAAPPRPNGAPPTPSGASVRTSFLWSIPMQAH